MLYPLSYGAAAQRLTEAAGNTRHTRLVTTGEPHGARYRATVPGTRRAPATAPGDGRRGSMDMKVVDVPERGRFEVRVDDRVVGLASYHVDGTTMTLPHTEVDPAVGGQGIGTALVAGVLAAARERGLHRAPLLLLHPPLHPAASRAHRSRRGRGPAALRPGDRRPLICGAPPGLPTLRGCRRRCSGSAATSGSPTTPPCSPRSTPRAPTAPSSRCSCSTRGSGGRPARPAGSSCSTAWPTCGERWTAPWSSGSGDPADGRPGAGRARSGATSVHVSADAGPYGRRRDAAVERALGDVPLVRTGSPYAVTPGRVTKARRHPVPGLHARSPAPGGRTAGGRPASAPGRASPGSTGVRSDDLPPPPATDGAGCRPPARRRRWRPGSGSATSGCSATPRAATCPGTDGTSRLSAYLKYGCIHPRTLLADLAAAGRRARRVRRFTDELAWREFYADVLWHRPETAHASTFDASAWARWRYDTGPDADERFAAWARGPDRLPDRRRRDAPAARRGVDAQPGADDRRVVPGQGPAPGLEPRRPALPATTSSTATWPATTTAGSGSPAPAPTPRRTTGSSTRSRQGKKFDPDGDYVRRWVPELRDVPDPSTCTSRGLAPGGVPAGYPEPIVDHAHERQVALARYQEVRSGA